MTTPEQGQGQEQDPGRRRLAMYHFGSTTVFAAQADPRFSFCLYVPPGLARPGAPTPDVIVAVHGTNRTMFEYRNVFAEFGRYNNCLVIAPLFPCGVAGDDNADGYKYMCEGDIRYDLVLLSILDQVGRQYGLEIDRFLLCGFSGGGHFTHRFLYLHPERLKGVSIGAPGSVTLIDDSRNWWVGTGNMKQRFGRALDLEALRRVPIHMVVGEADRETWEITHRPGDRYHMPGANDAGATRIERLTRLRDNLVEEGLLVRFETVPGISHSFSGVVDRMKDFFLSVIEAERPGRQDAAE